MKNEKIMNMCKKYEDYIKKWRHSDADFNHVKWMTKQVPDFLGAGRKEKVNRWLGFIQGVLWAKKIYTIEEMKEHNRPNENK